jgi:hypothetical protein
MIGKQGEQRLAKQLADFNDSASSILDQLSAAAGGQEARIRDLEKRVEALEAALAAMAKRGN